jgi:diacylglycerol O-acyltransferase / wax synthase
MNLQDAVMIWGDSAERPLHVGGYMVCSPPEGSRAGYVRGLVESLRKQPINAPPWNYRLADASAPGRALLPGWETVCDADTQHHIRHHVLPSRGGERELAALISHLHSQRLDMSRPLWEYHLIEGFGPRFVIYQKVHHALVDGFAGLHSFMRGTSDQPGARVRPAWSIRVGRASRSRQPVQASPVQLGGLSLTTLWRELSGSVPELCTALTAMLSAVMGDDSGLIAPCTAPRSPLNVAITPRRCIATTTLDLERLKAVARTESVTVNDVFLAMCGFALRRYLAEKRALPVRSLTAGVPVALARAGEEASGNRLGFICASLGTHAPNARVRLQAVARSMQAGKTHLRAIPDAVRGAYCLLLLLPALVNIAAPTLGRPMSNIVVSNLHGPERRRYLNGAAIEAMYPLSTIVSGIGLNITCLSYCEQLSVGLVACPDVTPDVARVASFLTLGLSAMERPLKRRRVSRARSH